MSGPELTREKHVERLAFEATDDGCRRVSRTTETIDRETQFIVNFDRAARRIVVTERELAAFRTGLPPSEYDWRRLSLTLDEAQALNARLTRLLAEAQTGNA